MVKRFRKIEKKRPVDGNTGRFWAAFSDAYTFGITLLVSMGLFGVVGYYLDEWVHTLPTFTVAFILIGIYLSFRVFIKDINRRGRVKNGQ
ncbi:AtpZ/AtpI family protein [Coprothermobacter platensis]|uniref:AtpZ/AtpI family protein n=1 Tax=Coprothermobacter platensis TaxID=108819 RepID=UPI001FE1DC51|nr:AtpZ/AtpI family protein [Coprothermobacter platensis]